MDKLEYKHNSKLTPNAKKLRKNMTKEESQLWYKFLRTYPVRFLRQKVIGNYIVDFYCSSAKLVVEIDGSQHYEEKEMLEDKKRTEFLNAYGLYVLRIPNNYINQKFNSVCEYIDLLVKDRIK